MLSHLLDGKEFITFNHQPKKVGENLLILFKKKVVRKLMVYAVKGFSVMRFKGLSFNSFMKLV